MTLAIQILSFLLSLAEENRLFTIQLMNSWIS